MELILQGWQDLKRYFRLENVECWVPMGYPSENAQEALKLIKEEVRLVIEV